MDPVIDVVPDRTRQGIHKSLEHDSAVPDTCLAAPIGSQQLVPVHQPFGIHTVLEFFCIPFPRRTSASTVYDAVSEHISTGVERMLIHDDRHDTEEGLFAGDLLRLSWLRTVAKIASREIEVLCIPVSKLAGNYLKCELVKIKNSHVQSATWHGNTRWWLSDKSTEISGADRAQRLVSAIIRSETTTHAFDSTSRKKVSKHQKPSDHSLFRQLAQSFVPPQADKRAISSNNSNHPIAASCRKAGVTATRDALQAAGFPMYDESISGTARDKKAKGRREVRDIKDLQHPNPDDKFSPGMVYTLVDQDMYIDNFARYAGANLVIITPEYNKLAGVGTDSVWYYTVSAQGEVVVTERVGTGGGGASASQSSVSGATYHTQRPWNYSENDFIFIEHLGKTAFTTYNVCVQYQKGSHHKWVWLARNATVNLSKAVCDMMRVAAEDEPLEGVALKKANNVNIVKGDSGLKQDTFLLGLFGEADNPTYSVKYAYDRGPNTSMEFAENIYKVLTKMGKNRPRGYGVSEVKRTMQMHMIWRPGGLEPLLVEFFGIPTEYRPWPNIMYTSQAGSLDEDVVEDATAVEAAPNVAGGGPGVADTRSEAACDAYLNKRMIANRNTIDPAENIKSIAALLLPCFINQVAGESGVSLASVTMVGRQVIYDNRRGAVQAARLQRNVELVAREPLAKTSLKREVAAKASVAPRGTTQYTEEMAIQTGRVGLLVKEVLRNCSFYQPGNDPHEVAVSIRMLTEIAMQASNVDTGGQVSGMHDTDYSKMDETISEYIYSWFVDFVLAFVHPSDYEEVKKILADNVDFVTMLNGKPVKSGFKNNSGSGVTTELNTVVSAFIEYVSTCIAITISTYRLRRNKELKLSEIHRTTIKTALKYYLKESGDQISYLFWSDFMFKKPDGSRADIHDIPFGGSSIEIDFYSIPYAVIGPKFGDDGVGPHLPGISNEDWNAAAMFFTEAIGMKLKVSFSRPQDGTYFLGRYYPQPLESLASYADVPKALRKLSIAQSMDVEKYKLKLLGYWTTDSLTPGIREYIIAVARMFKVDLHRYDGVVEIDEDGYPILSEEMSHLLATDRDMFYRVAAGPYCTTEEDVPMMQEAIAPQVNFENNMTEFVKWLELLSKCATREELDAFQLPDTDFDPEEEPEGTTRMAGPVASLLSAQSQLPSTSQHISDQLTFGDLATAAEIAMEECLREEEAGENTPPSASA